MNKILMTAGVVAVLVGGYMFLANSSQTQTTETNTSNESAAQVERSRDASDPVMMENELLESQNDSSQGSSAMQDRYQDYSPELAASASNDQKVVLFFHAGWCPTCIAANQVFSNNENEIPEDVLILKTDYDTQTELKEKYDVNYQHTFVQIDSEGNQITQWNGGDIDQIRARVQ